MLLGERRALQYCRPTVLQQQQTDMHRPIMKLHGFYLATHIHLHNTEVLGLAYMYVRWSGVCPSVGNVSKRLNSSNSQRWIVA